MKLPLAVRSQYLGLDDTRRAALLSILAAELTIRARDTYEVGTDHVADPARLRRHNEMLHCILAQQRGILLANDRYPEQVFVEMLFEGLHELGAEKALLRSLNAVAPAGPRKQVV